MEKEIEFIRCNEIADKSGVTYSYQYKLGNMNIVFTRGDYSFERNGTVGPSNEVLIVSFSGRKLFPREEVEYVLKHFEFDLSQRHYSFLRPARHPTDNRQIDILYYEQIREKPQTPD